MRATAFLLVAVAVSAAAGDPAADRQEKWKSIVASYAPTELKVDLAPFSAREKQAIFKLVEAAKVIDEIYWDQQGEYVLGLRPAVRNGPEALQAAFAINYGPFDAQNDESPFFGDRLRLPGAAFYPVDLTKDEFEKFLAANPAMKVSLQSPFTVVQRDGTTLKTAPYHEVHREKVERAARALEDASTYLDDPALVKYLRQRAADLRTDNYYQSDCDWIDLKDNRIEIVIGPYEVYNDELMGLKAAYEAYVYAIDREGSAELSTFVENLGYLQDSLPLPPEARQSPPGVESPLRVVNVLFTAGDARRGIQTVAFNLPNDETVREKKGSKKVMLKNLMQAKFDKILVPMSRVALGEEQAKAIAFTPFFNNILLHEISHALGVGFIKKSDGSRTTPNVELKELYPAMEEAKADVLGIYDAARLMEKKVLPAADERSIYLTFVASIFRTVRFGTGDAHGMANMIQLNWLIRDGALAFDPAVGFWKMDMAKIKPAIAGLAAELLRVQYQGDYAGAAKLASDYGKVPAEVTRTLGACGTIPVDIRPIFEYDK